MTHIDDWVEDRIYGECTEDEKYAVAFFFVKRMDAVSNIVVAPIMDQHKLFCLYDGEKYKVTGCSRLGDVWLNPDFDADYGYTKRINIDLCSNWSKD